MLLFMACLVAVTVSSRKARCHAPGFLQSMSCHTSAHLSIDCCQYITAGHVESNDPQIVQVEETRADDFHTLIVVPEFCQMVVCRISHSLNVQSKCTGWGDQTR